MSDMLGVDYGLREALATFWGTPIMCVCGAEVWPTAATDHTVSRIDDAYVIECPNVEVELVQHA